jgi:3-hydroxy acid dehydrogenase / malonic semialdehyde reductase
MSVSFLDEMRQAFSSEAHPLAGRTATVTGATSGIGLAATLHLLASGANVTAIARRADRLEELARYAKGNELLVHARRIQNRTDPIVGTLSSVAGDLCSSSFLTQVEDAGGFSNFIFVANAGLARGLDPVATARKEDWLEMIDTNLTSTFFQIQKAFQKMNTLPQGGHIVGIGSVAGHLSYEKGSVYCATKHAVRAFFQALRQEACGSGVRVSLISPGMVQTAFSEVRFSGDVARAQGVYEGAEALQSADIAKLLIWILEQPPHVNIDDVLVMPERQGSPFKIVRKHPQA